MSASRPRKKLGTAHTHIHISILPPSVPSCSFFSSLSFFVSHIPSWNKIQFAISQVLCEHLQNSAYAVRVYVCGWESVAWRRQWTRNLNCFPYWMTGHSLSLSSLWRIQFVRPFKVTSNIAEDCLKAHCIDMTKNNGWRGFKDLSLAKFNLPLHSWPWAAGSKWRAQRAALTVRTNNGCINALEVL